MTITLEQAKALKYKQVLYQPWYSNADGTPRRWRVNGKVKTWKHSLDRVEIPVKYGLHYCDYLTEDDLHLFCLSEADAIAVREHGKGKDYD